MVQRWVAITAASGLGSPLACFNWKPGSVLHQSNFRALRTKFNVLVRASRLVQPLPVIDCHGEPPSLFWLLCLDALPGVRGHVLPWLG